MTLLKIKQLTRLDGLFNVYLVNWLYLHWFQE